MLKYKRQRLVEKQALWCDAMIYKKGVQVLRTMEVGKDRMKEGKRRATGRLRRIGGGGV